MKNVKLFLALIVVLGFLLRIPPLTIDSFKGPDPLFHARMSELVLSEQAVPKYDELSMQGRHYSYAPLFHVSYALQSLFTGLDAEFLIRLFPSIHGALAALLVFVFARRIFGSDRVALFSAFFIATMALHLMRTSSYSRPDGLALLLIPFIIYLVYSQRYFPALLVSTAQILLHPLSSINLLAFLLVLAVLGRFKGWNLNWKKILLLEFIVVTVFLLWLNSLPYPPGDYVSGVSFESSELSSVTLMTVVNSLILAWVFVFIALVKLREQLFLKLWFALSFAFAFVGFRMMIFFSIPAALMAGFGLEFVRGKVFPYPKIFALLMFALVLFALVPGLLNPGIYTHQHERNAMLWLKEHSSEGESIMARWDMGHPLTYFTERKVIIDGYFEFAPDLDERNEMMKEMLQSSDCNAHQNWVKKFNADYFFISRKGLNSSSYEWGLFETFDRCTFQNSIYHGDGGKVLEYI